VSGRGYIVGPAPVKHYGWLMVRVGLRPDGVTRGFRALEAHGADGEPVAMVGYDQWTETSVAVHMACERPAAWRSLLGPAFHFPFVEAGKLVLVGGVAASNAASRSMTEHMGFREVGRVPDGYKPGDDLIVYSMRRADCRWIAPEQRG
jgi:L-amino acid N-acyltransferase YncA